MPTVRSRAGLDEAASERRASLRPGQTHASATSLFKGSHRVAVRLRDLRWAQGRLRGLENVQSRAVVILAIVTEEVQGCGPGFGQV